MVQSVMISFSDQCQLDVLDQRRLSACTCYIKDDVPDLTGHMVSLQGGFDQAMWNGPVGVGQVQTQNGQITS